MKKHKWIDESSKYNSEYWFYFRCSRCGINKAVPSIQNNAKNMTEYSKKGQIFDAKIMEPSCDEIIMDEALS